jgi:hypothetical protein
MKSSVKPLEPLNTLPPQLYTNCDRLNTANATRKRKTRQGSLCSTLQGAKTRFAPDQYYAVNKTPDHDTPFRTALV